MYCSVQMYLMQTSLDNNTYVALKKKNYNLCKMYNDLAVAGKRLKKAYDPSNVMLCRVTGWLSW